MSENVDVVLRIFAAFNEGDFEAALTEFHDDAVMDFSLSNSPYRGVYEGKDRIRKHWRDWRESWERLTWSPEEVCEGAPGTVVLVNHITGYGRGSGIEIDARGGHVWELEQGRVRRMQLFQSGADARRAAGLD